MSWDKIVEKTLQHTKYTTQKENWERLKCDTGFVACKSVKMCVLAKLPGMSSYSANIEKNRIN